MFDVIKPVFNISKEFTNKINRIENLLEDINIKNDVKKKNLLLKSKVRSIHSSLAIEANSLSINDVSNIINDKLIIGDRREIQEVKNANQLYENISDYNWKSETDFLKAHVVLMKYFDDDNGWYRTHGEGVEKDGKIIYIAPDSFLVPSLMKSLFEYISGSDLHPLILSSVFHYYFVYVHPFTDGNGRLARFWVSLILSNYNEKFKYIPIEEQLYAHKDEYYKSIDDCHSNGNCNVFINFMLNIVEETLKVIHEETINDNILIKLNNTQLKIIELIKENSKITRRELAKYIGISEDGIKYNLNKLVKNNIIERIGPDKGGYWTIKK